MNRPRSIANSTEHRPHWLAALPGPDRVRRIVVDIDGLYFEHSQVGLANQLRGSTGIRDIVVDPRAGTVSIMFDENVLSDRAVRRLISECGYELADDDHAMPSGG